jgi:transposase
LTHPWEGLRDEFSVLEAKKGRLLCAVVCWSGRDQATEAEKTYMLKLEGWMDIKLLSQQGHSIRAIMRITGSSRNTIRRVLRAKTPEAFRVDRRSSKLDDYKGYLAKRHKECALSSVRLLEEIRPMGYVGSIDTIRRYIQTLREPSKAQQKMTVRFETGPGQQAQADWASCGRFVTPEGRTISVSIFLMVLSFSRYLYVEFTSSMKIATLIGCHLNAFNYFGGWPETVLYDNMKQVKLSRTEWNPLLVDFASYYGIVPRTHQVRRPRTKGKIERMVDYIKGNFLNGRVLVDLEDLNTQAMHWLNNVANVRVHATTQQRPLDLLGKENLAAVSSMAPYQVNLKAIRKVNAEGFVRYDRSRYSVPPEEVGKKVIVERGEQSIVIRSGSLIVAEHGRATKPGSCIAATEHVEAMWRLSLRKPSPPSRHWEVTFKEPVAIADLAKYEEVAL